MIVAFHDTLNNTWWQCWNVSESIIKACPMVGVDLYLLDTGKHKTAEELEW